MCTSMCAPPGNTGSGSRHAAGLASGAARGRPDAAGPARRDAGAVCRAQFHARGLPARGGHLRRVRRGGAPAGVDRRLRRQGVYRLATHARESASAWRSARAHGASCRSSSARAPCSPPWASPSDAASRSWRPSGCAACSFRRVRSTARDRRGSCVFLIVAALAASWNPSPTRDPGVAHHGATVVRPRHVRLGFLDHAPAPTPARRAASIGGISVCVR